MDDVKVFILWLLCYATPVVIYRIAVYKRNKHEREHREHMKEVMKEYFTKRDSS